MIEMSWIINWLSNYVPINFLSKDKLINWLIKLELHVHSCGVLLLHTSDEDQPLLPCIITSNPIIIPINNNYSILFIRGRLYCNRLHCYFNLPGHWVELSLHSVLYSRLSYFISFFLILPLFSGGMWLSTFTQVLFEYKFDVLLLHLSIFILCYFLLLLHYSSERNTVIFNCTTFWHLWFPVTLQVMSLHPKHEYDALL